MKEKWIREFFEDQLLYWDEIIEQRTKSGRHRKKDIQRAIDSKETIENLIHDFFVWMYKKEKYSTTNVE